MTQKILVMLKQNYIKVKAHNRKMVVVMGWVTVREGQKGETEHNPF